MNNLAPIGLCTYTRINHLKRTINALQKNTLAKQSELYVFSDAPSPGDEKKVTIVRDYLYTINGFKKINIVERKTNCRLSNCRGGLTELLSLHGKAIFMEDDIVTAPGFLKFINEGLNLYKDNNKIISISGYSPPIGASKYCFEDVFFLYRFNAWGFGIWKNKYEQIAQLSKKEFIDFIINIKAVKEFINGGGEDMLQMLRMDTAGEINALDVKAMYCQYKHKQFTVYPKKSLTLNIGHDGSGIHCDISNKFDVDLWNETKFKFNHKIQENDQIVQQNNKFRRVDTKTKFKELIKVFGFLPLITKIKEKLSK